MQHPDKREKPKEKEIFHGGCLSCYSQEMFGKSRCYRCQYHKANWALEDLSIEEKEYKIYKDQQEQKKSKIKPLTYKNRKELISQYWSHIQVEYNEANNATNLYNMFSEILEVLPNEILKDNQTLGLFHDALIDKIGKKNSKIEHKTYI